MQASENWRNKISMHKTTHKTETEGHFIFSWHLGESMPWPHVWACHLVRLEMEGGEGSFARARAG